MTLCKQRTLRGECRFEGKGLHSGKYTHMTLKPAGPGTGIVFRRTDLGEDALVHAVADNVSSTARSTTISEGQASVATVEHLMSALTGLGVDNVLVELDNLEVPILDGSARFYAEAFARTGFEEQDAPRKVFTLDQAVEVSDPASGAFVRLEPSDTCSYEVTVDFGSHVLGVQQAAWDPSVDYAAEVAPCRTFVFFHELEYLFANNLIKGGDVDNAIVIVEHPVTREQLDRITGLFGRPQIDIREDGYLDNLQLHFPNECGRHKLLDLVGDLRLACGFLSARVTAFKPGHTLNTLAAKAVREQILLQR